MKVLVAVKRVPDGNVPLRLKPDGSEVDLAGMPMRINPFDEAALELAVQWKEADTISEVIAVSIGNEACQETLRHALALGADRVIRIDTAHAIEPLAAAKLLHALIQHEAPDLVLLGKQSSDEGHAQTGPMLAALLGWPQGAFASALAWENSQLIVTREIEDGQEMLALPLPAVITADLRLAEPRYLKLPQVLQAKKKPIETLAASALSTDLTPRLTLLQVTPPPPRQPARRTRSAAELLDWLRAEGLLQDALPSAAEEKPDEGTPPAGRALVLAEHDGLTLHAATSRSIAAARLLSDDISVLVAGHQVQAIATKVAALAGVSRVLLADAPQLEHLPAEDLASLLAQQARQSTALLGTATPFGKAILPRAAALLDSAMLSDVVEIQVPDTFVRPIHAGEALATVRNAEAIKILTVRPAAFPRTGTQKSAPIEIIPVQAATPLSTWLSTTHPDSDRPALTEAKIIVSGGSGLQSVEKFHAMLEPLADRLGAAIGATLSAVNSGFIGNNHQVGQTGATVAPDFYFAIGLSGAAQHLAGMRDARVVVAINKDPEAPICRHADYVLEGDLFEKVPELLKALG